MRDDIGLEPAQWRLDETPSGWVLSFRSGITLDEVLEEADLGRSVYYISLVFWLPAPQARAIHSMYESANSAHSVELHGDVLELPQGTFRARNLESLRVTADGASPGRFTLTFTGDATPDVRLIGWPGFERDAAEAMARAVRSATDRGVQQRHPAER